MTDIQPMGNDGMPDGYSYAIGRVLNASAQPTTWYAFVYSPDGKHVPAGADHETEEAALGASQQIASEHAQAS